MYPQFINEYGTSRAIYYTDQSDIYMIGMSWSNHITHFIEFYNHLLHILHYPQDYPLVRSLFYGDFIDEIFLSPFYSPSTEFEWNNNLYFFFMNTIHTVYGDIETLNKDHLQSKNITMLCFKQIVCIIEE